MARTHSMLLPGLHFWRARRGYTQAQLAERIGMRRPTVWRIEAGRPARVRTAHLLAIALGVHLSRLQLHPDPHAIHSPAPLPQASGGAVARTAAVTAGPVSGMAPLVRSTS
jgi:transcriptional regulator with XRE-family HTH domain